MEGGTQGNHRLGTILIKMRIWVFLFSLLLKVTIMLKCFKICKSLKNVKSRAQGW